MYIAAAQTISAEKISLIFVSLMVTLKQYVQISVYILDNLLIKKKYNSWQFFMCVWYVHVP